MQFSYLFEDSSIKRRRTIQQKHEPSRLVQLLSLYHCLNFWQIKESIKILGGLNKWGPHTNFDLLPKQWCSYHS